jgi:hypothetical protein
MKNTADVTGGKPIAVLLQSISVVSAINPLVAFYDIHGGKREVLFFCFVPDTTRDTVFLFLLVIIYCLLSTLLETGVGANNCKCSRDQRLNVPFEAQRSSG